MYHQAKVNVINKCVGVVFRQARQTFGCAELLAGETFSLFDSHRIPCRKRQRPDVTRPSGADFLHVLHTGKTKCDNIHVSDKTTKTHQDFLSTHDLAWTPATPAVTFGQPRASQTSRQDADHSTDAQGQRKERQEHHQAGQCVENVEEGRRLPRLHRAPRPVHLRCHRIGGLPDRPVHLDGRAVITPDSGRNQRPQRRRNTISQNTLVVFHGLFSTHLQQLQQGYFFSLLFSVHRLLLAIPQ